MFEYIVKLKKKRKERNGKRKRERERNRKKKKRKEKTKSSRCKNEWRTKSQGSSFTKSSAIQIHFKARYDHRSCGATFKANVGTSKVILAEKFRWSPFRKPKSLESHPVSEMDWKNSYFLLNIVWKTAYRPVSWKKKKSCL